MKVIPYNIVNSTSNEVDEVCLKEEREPNLVTREKSERKASLGISTEITEVRPYLLLCGAMALKKNRLKDLKVTCVINATNELPDTPLPDSKVDENGNIVSSEILYIRVGVDDKYDSDLSLWMDLIADTVEQVKQAAGRTLIHCMAGVSRSPALCIAYLIKYENLTLDDSYNELKMMRSIIRPNSGIFGQLVEFEKRITNKQTVLMVFSEVANTFIPHLYQEDYERYLYYRQYRRGTKT